MFPVWWGRGGYWEQINCNLKRQTKLIRLKMLHFLTSDSPFWQGTIFRWGRKQERGPHLTERLTQLKLCSAPGPKTPPYSDPRRLRMWGYRKSQQNSSTQLRIVLWCSQNSKGGKKVTSEETATMKWPNVNLWSRIMHTWLGGGVHHTLLPTSACWKFSVIMWNVF